MDCDIAIQKTGGLDCILPFPWELFNEFILPLVCFKAQHVKQTYTVFLENLGAVTFSTWQSECGFMQ